MIAVRDIEILNYPHSKTEYRHRLGELNGIGDMLGLSPRLLKQHTCCDSVILARQIDDLDHKLEKYRIHNNNMELDRWSLDSRLYRRK